MTHRLLLDAFCKYIGEGGEEERESNKKMPYFPQLFIIKRVFENFADLIKKLGEIVQEA